MRTLIEGPDPEKLAGTLLQPSGHFCLGDIGHCLVEKGRALGLTPPSERSRQGA